MAYIGTSPSNGVRRRFVYEATASQTSFSGSDENGVTLTYVDSLYLDVFQNGIKLKAGDDYTATTGTTVVLVQGASVNDVVEMVAFDIFSVGDTVSAKDGGNFAGNVGMGGTLGVTGTLTANGGAVFNEASADVDFRVESNGQANMLFVDGGNDTVSFQPNSGNLAIKAGRVDSTNNVRLEAGGTTSTYLEYRGYLGHIFDVNTTESMRIESGNVLVGTTNATVHTTADDAGVAIRGDGGVFATRLGADVAAFNRGTNDGTVVQIMQAGTAEGTISISGTTTSYNGGHLSRWSRLLDNSKDTSIVKGTVMTNLDEMVEWGDEDNEQLNKMAVSSVEGDANVAGVFVNWDNDDDWNDMNIAMTGDMVIRIAQGVTVARGNLLISAGDGTAKTQDDDIVRSKTIAKVTSTNVSHTYDDGTYLVPCVLMAC